MSSTFKIQKPLVVAQLSEPVGHAAGRYVVSDVHGGVPGTRKRKRAELAVGIDGEGTNLYDVCILAQEVEMGALLTYKRSHNQNSSHPTLSLHKPR